MGTDANRVFEREANERDVRGDGFRVHEQSFVVVVVGKSKYWGGGVVLGIDLSLRRDGRRVRFARETTDRRGERDVRGRTNGRGCFDCRTQSGVGRSGERVYRAKRRGDDRGEFSVLEEDERAKHERNVGTSVGGEG